MNIQTYGPPKEETYRKSKRDAWQYELVKKLSSYPILKWMLNPLWAEKRFELNIVPINVEVNQPDTVSLPRKILERVIDKAELIHVMDICYCRSFAGIKECGDIGCMSFGPTTKQIHPTHGRHITKKEAYAHVEKAAKAGLVANIAWVWLDTYMWGIENLNELLFTCFCQDHCIYRANLKKRGPNLNNSHKRLPGSSIKVDSSKCKGCEICVENCYVAEISLVDDIATPGNDCKACGKCVEHCPNEAISIEFEDEEKVFNELWHRISSKTNIA